MFTITSVDGWTFNVATATHAIDGGMLIDSFELTVRCPHDRDLMHQDLPPSLSENCSCVPPASVLETRARLFAEWSDKVGKLIRLP